MSASSAKSLNAREKWSGKIAFVFSAAASAVGLGNFWRFPYLAARNGGGTFLIVFLILTLTIGVSLLVLEVAMGKTTGKSCLEAFGSFGKRYRIVGVISAIVPFILASYYCIIGGWVIKYFWAYIWEDPHTLADGGTYFNSFTQSTIESPIFMLIFLFIGIAVVFRGVKSGIEKTNMVLMPLLIVLSLFLAIYVICQPGAMDGVKYFFEPNLDFLDLNCIVSAMGQTFFCLSLGVGIMITYGSYLKPDADTIGSCRNVSFVSILVSILAGLCIVPATFFYCGSADAVQNSVGPGLMFITMPKVFLGLGSMAKPIGIIFFLLVFFAAITSIISFFESGVSNLCDSARVSRTKACLICAPIFIVLGLIINSGYCIFPDFNPLGEGSYLLDLVDKVVSSVMLPIAATLLCVCVGWLIGPKRFVQNLKKGSRFSLDKVWVFIIKYVAPFFLLVILLSGFIEFR
ncbi:MAG: sodium-dependent transporter [Enterococcus sp.]|nr:sodium-dependent transporter [Enterococcus sp.]